MVGGDYLWAVLWFHCHTAFPPALKSKVKIPPSHLVWQSQTHVARKACGGSGDMTIPNMFWRNVEVVSAPPPLYLNFYCRLAMTAEPSVKRVVNTNRNFYLWLRRAIPGNLLAVIDRRNYMCGRTNLVWPCPQTHSQHSGSVKGLATSDYPPPPL